MPTDKSRMVLRFFSGVENATERMAYLFDFLERTGIRRVLLFTGCFLEESTFLPLSYYEKHAAILASYMPRLREMGVEVGINVLNTVGHVYYANDGEFTFKRAVDIYGRPSNGSVCLLDEDVYGFIQQQYAYYAALKPAVIFFDDDVRNIKLDSFVCFCDEHIQQISQRVGKPLSREDIRSALLSDSFEVNPVKQAYMDCIRDDMRRLFDRVEQTVHRISPSTEIGMMTGVFPSMTFDRDLPSFFREFAPKGVDRIRTGMGFYREGEHKEIPLYFSSPMIQRNLIASPGVEIQPEVENDIYSLFYNSKAETHMQLTWCLSNGLRNMQMSIFDMADSVIPDFDVYTDLLAEKMPYYNALTELIPEGSRTAGVGMWKHSRSLLYRRTKSGQIGEFLYTNYWYQWLALDGMPIGYDWDTTPWLFLTGDDILGASPEEIDRFLQRGAVLEQRAAECLVHRGYGKRIGIASIRQADREFAGERFTDHPLNGSFGGVHNSCYFHSGLIAGREVAFIDYEPGAQPLSYIVDHHRQAVASGVTLYENPQGERFCILPMDAGLFQQFVQVNYKRKEQLVNVFGWVARRALPVVSQHANVVVNIHEFEDRNVLTLFNLTADPISPVKLTYALQGRMELLDAGGRLVPAAVTAEDGTTRVETELPPMGCLVLVDQKKRP